MITINLLPWREYEKIYQRKIVRRLFCATTLLALCIITGTHIKLSKNITERQEHIALLEEKMSYYPLPSRVYRPENISKKLFNHKKFTKKLFVGLGRWNPSHVCFVEITRRLNTLYFLGNARSIADLTAFLISEKSMNLFKTVQIKQIEQHKEVVQFIFEGMEGAELS